MAYDDDLTYIAWLTDLLEESCLELESDYDGIEILIEPQLAPLQEQRTTLEMAMFVFKGIKADPDAGTQAETFEEFQIRQKQEYDD